MEFKIANNRLYFTRKGEIGVVSVPLEGCIRFQATASSLPGVTIGDNV